MIEEDDWLHMIVALFFLMSGVVIMMKKVLYMIFIIIGTALIVQVADTSRAEANVEIAYWKGDRNCPIFVERNDGSMIAFKVNTAQFSNFKPSDPNDVVIEFVGYDIDKYGNFKEYTFNIWFGTRKKEYTVFYPDALVKKLQKGAAIYIENPYQLKVCKMISDYCLNNNNSAQKTTTKTNDVKIEYWKGDTDCPIWVLRDDNSMLVFRISSARELDAAFTKNRKLLLFDVYEIESNGSIKESQAGHNGYGLLYNADTYVVLYPESRRFPSGQELKIENQYQLKICNMLIRESRLHDKYPFNP